MLGRSPLTVALPCRTRTGFPFKSDNTWRSLLSSLQESISKGADMSNNDSVPKSVGQLSETNLDQRAHLNRELRFRA